METALVIAEKPSLMKAIQSAYNALVAKGGSYPYKLEFTCFAGHAMKLMEPEKYDSRYEKWEESTLPFIPDEFKYEVGVKDLFKNVEEACQRYHPSVLINACDSAREGELIFKSYYRYKNFKTPVKRLWCNNVTEKGLQDALLHLRDDSEMRGLENSAFLRAYFDQLVGVNFTRATTLKAGKVVQTGRVMTSVIKIIKDRDAEIENFVPAPFYEFTADFGKYQGLWERDGKSRLLDKKYAEAFKKKLEGKKGEVTSVEKVKETRKAPELYSLSHLQQDANKVYKFSAQKVLDLAQSLYEKKVLSYPRTDYCHLPSTIGKEVAGDLKALTLFAETSKEALAVCSNREGIINTLKDKRYVNDAKIGDHHALIPTYVDPNSVSMTADEKKIYTLVAKRFLSIFMPPCIKEKTTVVTTVDGETFVTKGTILVDPGYTVLYPNNSKDVILPDLYEKETYDVKDITIHEGKTTPPAHYTEATLLSAMENAGKFVDDKEEKEILSEIVGLGTAATRAPLIEKIISQGFIERQKDLLLITEKGKTTAQLYENKPISSPSLTADWEMKLKKVAEGKMSYDDFYQEMIKFITDGTADLLKTIPHIWDSEKSKAKEIGKCPKCGKPFIVTDKYYMCSGGRDCGVIAGKETFGAKISEKDIMAVLDGDESSEKTFKFSKDGKSFDKKGVLFYDKEVGKFRVKSTQVFEKKQMDAKCPSCGKPLNDLGEFWGCSGYNDGCKFSFSKKIKGHEVTEGEFLKVLAGEVAGPVKFHEFKGNGDKMASFKLVNGKLEFVFSK